MIDLNSFSEIPTLSTCCTSCLHAFRMAVNLNICNLDIVIFKNVFALKVFSFEVMKMICNNTLYAPECPYNGG